MKQRDITVEILAPAGSYESMTAAIQAGADAVYIGGNQFGARAYANNLDEPMLLEAIDYAHLHGCKLYLTVNTLLKESEMEQLVPYLTPYYQQGLDAVIVQDMGVFAAVRQAFPDLPVHASTQMTITGVHGAKTLKQLGAERIVTARELSLEEIRQIHDLVDIEIESFVHGALCYCYSGQCLFSSLVGGRSGNRGRCAQPCRLPYDVKRDGRKLNSREERYVLSLKDLCTLDILPDILEAGVTSLKIEGRMKSPRYTSGVVSIYRKYVDRYLCNGRTDYRVDSRDKRILLDLFDRGGFTEGYYGKHNGKDMVALKEKPAFREGNQELFDYLDQTYVESKKQEPIWGAISIGQGTPVELTLGKDEVAVTVMGAIPLEAVNQPVTKEKVEKQIRKTGNTPFVLEHLEAEIRGAVFIPVQELNELRRNGLEALQQAILAPYRRQLLDQKIERLMDDSRVETDLPDSVQMHVSLEQPEQLGEVLGFCEVNTISVDAGSWEPGQWRKTVDECHKKQKKCCLVLPHIFRKEAQVYFSVHADKLKEAGFDGLVIRSLEEVEFCKEIGLDLPMLFDYTMYSFNRLSKSMLYQMGASRLTAPVELNNKELEERDCRGEELIVYGKLPMMVTAQCISKTVEGCKKTPQLLTLKDRMGKELPVKNHCTFCYNTIYNASPLSLLGSEKQIEGMCPASIRLQFTTETANETRQILQAFISCYLKKEQWEMPLEEFTRGHFKRGVE